MIQRINEWLAEHPTFENVIRYVIWVVLIFFVVQFLKRFVRKRIPDGSARYRTQKGIGALGYILITILTISFFTGAIKDFALAIGLLSAGIAITLQELFLSIAGSFYILIVKVYKPGDRIQLSGIKGDVIDVDIVYTTMMEIGEWISGDNYSGRIVKISNANVFKGAVYNYSQDFPFIWDEFNLPIRYGSDIELAKEIIINAADDILSDFVKESQERWKSVVRTYYIENAEVKPTVAITMNDNWVQLNVRYIVDYKKRRSTRDSLHDRILKDINNSNGKIKLGSATFEIVGFPSITINKSQGHEN